MIDANYIIADGGIELVQGMGLFVVAGILMAAGTLIRRPVPAA